MNKFPQIFKELRKKAGLTQVETANVLYTSPQIISRWENGKNQPSIDTLLEISNYFSVSVDYLLGREIIQEKVILSDIFAFIKNLPAEKQIENAWNICNKMTDAFFASVFDNREEEYNHLTNCVIINKEQGLIFNSYGQTEEENRIPIFLVLPKNQTEYANNNKELTELFKILADLDTLNTIIKISNSNEFLTSGFDFTSLKSKLNLEEKSFDKVLSNLNKYGFIIEKTINGCQTIYYFNRRIRIMFIIYFCYSFLFNQINGNIN